MTRLDLKASALALLIAATPLMAQDGARAEAQDGPPDPGAIMDGLIARAGAERAALRAPDPEGPTLVSIDFAYDMRHEAFSAAMEGSAPVVAATPGLIWKVWSDDPEAGLATGTYLFSGREAAEFYVQHVFPAGPPSKPGVSGVEVRVMEVMDAPSRATRAPLN